MGNELKVCLAGALCHECMSARRWWKCWQETFCRLQSAPLLSDRPASIGHNLYLLPAQMAQKWPTLNFFDGIYTAELLIYIWYHYTNLKVVKHIITRDASVSVSVSVSVPIRSFSADRVSVRRVWSKSDVVCIVFCVKVKPHKRHKNIIKHHKVFVYYISSVRKPFHSLIRGAYEYLSHIAHRTALYWKLSYYNTFLCNGRLLIVFFVLSYLSYVAALFLCYTFKINVFYF